MPERKRAAERVALLVPSGTYRAADHLDAARRVGLEVVVLSDHRQTAATDAPVIDFGEVEGAARVVTAAGPFQAVIAVDDAGALIAQRACELLGLTHHRPGVIDRTRDKAAMRTAVAAAAGETVRQPRWQIVDVDDVDVAIIAVGWPCVVKPTGLSASRGVIRADDLDAARAAVWRAAAISTDAGRPSPIIVEQYIDGEEMALDGLLRDGELEVLALWDKPDPMVGPFFDETLLITPSRHPAEVQARVVATVAAAIAAMGLAHGPVHAEVRIDREGGVWFLEAAARTIGGLCSRALRFGLDVSLEELVIRHAIGRELPRSTHRRGAAGALMIPVRETGRLVSVDGLDRVQDIDGIVEIELTIPPGRIIRPLPEGDRYLGFVLARAASADAVEQALRAAWSEIVVRVEP